MSWTDERVELLKKMWSEGQSASQIAKELGGVTRNAVIGKVHRLGLSNRAGAAPAAAEAKPEPKAQPAAAKAKPQPKAAPANKPEQAPEAKPQPAATTPAVSPARKQIIPAGQPLPPQPSANEISPEALAKVSEIEKKAKKTFPDGTDRADLQMARRRSGHRGLLVLRPAGQGRQALLRGPRRRGLPTHERPARPPPLTDRRRGR